MTDEVSDREKMCGICFYYREGREDDQGTCHRYPPKIIESIIIEEVVEEGRPSAQSTRFPIVYDNSYCGEWKLARDGIRPFPKPFSADEMPKVVPII